MIGAVSARIPARFAWAPRCVPAAVWLVLLVSSIAQAGDAENKALARELAKQGMGAADQADWPLAEQRFRSSLELFPSAVVRYNLASALAEQAKLVEAVERLREVEQDERAQPALRAASRTLREQIEARLPRLTLHVSGDTEGVELFLDDRPLPLTALDLEVPVDPGHHEVRRRRFGVESRWPAFTFDIAERERREALLDLPPEEAGDAVQPEPVAPAPTPVAAPAAPSPRQTAEQAAAREPKEPRALSSGEPASSRTPTDAAAKPRSLWQSPWLWAGAAVLIGGAAITAGVLAGGGSERASPVHGNLGTGLVTVGP
jgi:hypothetical protein